MEVSSNKIGESREEAALSVHVPGVVRAGRRDSALHTLSVRL